MENLFDNPIIFIALILIISSFFKRLTQGKTEEQQKRQRPIDPGREFSAPEITPEPSARPSKERPGRPPSERSLQKIDRENDKKQREAEDSLQILIEQKKALEGKARQIESLTGRKKSMLSTNDPPKEGLIHPEKRQLIEGIIWSEVLGPPRVKRPYNRRRSR